MARARRTARSARSKGEPARPDGDRAVVPVVAEELAVTTRRVPTGGVRVRKTVARREAVVDEPLLREQVEIERVAVNRPVEAAPPVREEGDTVVIPLVEETLVVEKRLMVREEIRITRRRVEARDPRRVTLRSEQVEVDRVPPADPSPPPGAAA
jgi:uncharacterized protein (TIGR02271 family)